MTRRVVGLALGGGALRGLAHVGVLQVLAEAGLQVDVVAGTSMGGLVSALYAVGWTPEQMEALSLSLRRDQLYDPALRWRDLVSLAMWLSASFYGWPWRRDVQSPAGLLRGDKLEEQLRLWTGSARLGDVKVPLAVLAADLLTGRPVVFAPPAFTPGIAARIPEAAVVSEATLAEACRASTAVPGIFVPKPLGGYSLVDGGIVDNVPAGLLRAMGADVVIAVDVAGARRPAGASFWEVVAGSIEVMTDARARSQLALHADYVLHPDPPDLSLLDLEHVPEAIEAGRRAARAALSELAELWEAAPPDRISYLASPARAQVISTGPAEVPAAPPN